jgi:hypothetical protein
MYRPSPVVLNDLRTIEAELDAIASLEGEYPEYHDQLQRERDQLILEYEDAVQREEEALMSDPPPPQTPDQSQNIPEDYYEDGGDSGGVCHELPVSGTGDRICLIDWGELERERLAEKDKYFSGVTVYGLDPVQAHAYELDPEQVALREHTEIITNKGKTTELVLNPLKTNGRGSGQPSRGTRSFDVSARISQKLRDVQADVEARGGFLASSGGLRRLNADVGSNRSATSFHYAGLAVDLFTLSACLNPNGVLPPDRQALYGRKYVDQYVLQRDGENRNQRFLWRVWCRSSKPDHPDVQSGPIIACQFKHDRGFDDSVSVDGPFFDLTKVFEAHGFERIAGRGPWNKGSSEALVLERFDYMEWWHFEYNAHLTKDVSRFGEALLEVHRAEKLIWTPPWRYRMAKFTGYGFE